MKSHSLKNTLRATLVLFFYLALFLYAVVFNNSSGWMLLFFLSFLLIGNLISLIPAHKKIHLEMLENSTYRVGDSSRLMAEVYAMRPFLLPLNCLTLAFPSTDKKKVPFFLTYTGKRKELSFHWTPKARGYFSVLPVTFSSTDFLRLITKESVQQLTGQFPVLPKQEDELARKLLQGILLVEPNFYVPLGNRTFMIRNFREHQSGDPLRMIDWKQSSKRNELIVKEYEQEQEQKTCIVFYGQQHTHFEKLLSVFFSVSQQLSEKMPYTTQLLAEYPAEIPEEYILAALQPLSEEVTIPVHSNKKLIIFAPELTKHLENQLQILSKTNELLLITFKAERLYLQYNEQVIDIETMEVQQ